MLLWLHFAAKQQGIDLKTANQNAKAFLKIKQEANS
jgi:hypothetical protein